MRLEGKASTSIALIRTAMIEKKMTQAELADAADCHEKTIQNLLSGRTVRDQTLFDVCMVLGLDFERVRNSWVRDDRHGLVEGGVEVHVAPVQLGAYTRAAVDHYIGSYLTLRPSFSVPAGVMAYRTDIFWDERSPSLAFEERDRPDKPYANCGRLHISAASTHVHLVSSSKGAVRMVVLSRPDATGHMRGLIVTMHKHGAHFLPVSAPMAYVRREDFKGVLLGEISGKQAADAGYAQVLGDTLSQGYARLIMGA
jgi:hypothetical protein